MADVRGRHAPRVAGWRQRIFEIIFETETPLGKAFDVALLIAICVSVVAVILESVGSINRSYRAELRVLEWMLTLTFTVEYALRLICVRRPWRYALSFFGIVDLLAILPTYLTLVLPGASAQSLLVIRGLRLLRVFRVFKLARYLNESQLLVEALKASARKIFVFLMAVVTIVAIIGSAMYLIEGSQPGTGFTSIPAGIYWAIVSLTTVGFGDITPQTVAGKVLASMVMIVGYGIIAVPTGIVTAELSSATRQRRITTQVCPSCQREGHEPDAAHCKFCGAKL